MDKTCGNCKNIGEIEITKPCFLCINNSKWEKEPEKILTELGEVFEETKNDFFGIGSGVMLSEKEGKKFDNGKTVWSFFPLYVAKEVANVYAYGAKKYNESNTINANWKKVEPKSRYYDAFMRHMESWQEGNIFDSESKLYHLAHAIFNLMCLLWHDMKGTK